MQPATQAGSGTAVCPVVTFERSALTEPTALTSLASAYTRYVPPCLTKPTGLVPVAATMTDWPIVGGVVSNVKVLFATGVWTFSALSVARDSTVYVPSAGKLAAGKA